MEDESRRPNHSRAHFLPPAWWDVVSWKRSRLIFNPNTDIFIQKCQHLSTFESLFFFIWLHTCQSKYFILSSTLNLGWSTIVKTKGKKYGVRDICKKKNHKRFTGEIWESGLLSNSRRKKKDSCSLCCNRVTRSTATLWWTGGTCKTDPK